jgi:hypothetical protein
MRTVYSRFSGAAKKSQGPIPSRWRDALAGIKIIIETITPWKNKRAWFVRARQQILNPHSRVGER